MWCPRCWCAGSWCVVLGVERSSFVFVVGVEHAGDAADDELVETDACAFGLSLGSGVDVGWESDAYLDAFVFAHSMVPSSLSVCQSVDASLYRCHSPNALQVQGTRPDDVRRVAGSTHSGPGVPGVVRWASNASNDRNRRSHPPHTYGSRISAVPS